MSTRTVDCKIGKHTWEQQSARGRAPANCPEHDPKKSGARRHRRKASAEEGSALERARAFLETAEKLGEELRDQREELEKQIAKINSALEDLGLEEDVEEEASTPASTCRICKDAARAAELDERAVARPGA